MNVKTISTLIQACVLSGVILLAMPSGSSAQNAGDALSNVDRETLDAPTCNQMKSYSAQVAQIQSESQESPRRPSWRRICNMLGRATSLLAETLVFMRAHLGQCNITEAGLNQMASLTRDIAANRAKNCR